MEPPPPLGIVDPIDRVLHNEFAIAGFVVLIGTILGLVIDRLSRRIMARLGVPDAVEGTAFERTMRGFGTSTVSIVARMSMWFVIGVSVLVALSIVQVRYTEVLRARITAFLPELFLAILVLIAGIVVGDKVELAATERLKGIKLPQVSILPRLAKYSVVYVAALVALSQIGVATDALIVLLGVYVFAIVVFSVVAFWDLLRSGAAGVYLLLHQPYGIGDRIRVDDREGIVQEVTVFVTRIEDDDVEHVVPNRKVFEHGVARHRE